MSIRKNTGFTLIEVLIAVLIFGVGLLTVASLQAVARKANYEAVQRTTAAQLAQGLLERMRANRAGLFTYVNGGPGRQLGGGSLVAPANTCQNRASPCTSIQVAEADLFEWERLLDGSFEIADGAAVGGLVAPTACIRGPLGGNPTGVYEVAIAWRGVTESAVAPDDDCGAANPQTPAGFRRVVTVSTFINAL